MNGPSPAPTLSGSPCVQPLLFFRAVAEHNRARARRRHLRARYVNSQGETVDIWEDEVRPAGPSDDDSMPAGRQEVTLNLPEFCSRPLPAWTLALQFSQ